MWLMILDLSGKRVHFYHYFPNGILVHVFSIDPLISSYLFS